MGGNGRNRRNDEITLLNDAANDAKSLVQQCFQNVMQKPSDDPADYRWQSVSPTNASTKPRIEGTDTMVVQNPQMLQAAMPMMQMMMGQQQHYSSSSRQQLQAGGSRRCSFSSPAAPLPYSPAARPQSNVSTFAEYERPNQNQQQVPPAQPPGNLFNMFNSNSSNRCSQMLTPKSYRDQVIS